MKDINRVMACVDLSDYSKEIIEYALALADGSETVILLFNVINSRDVDSLRTVGHHFPEKINVESYIERVQAERHQIIQEMIEEHFLQYKAQIKILFRVGIPYKTILEAIETEKVDLVVIASKGKSNLIGTLHGSNAEKVFRHSPVPVLSVRDRERFSRNRSMRNQ
ncbi:MAG: universal stress protein [Desulfobulbaceae bacterium]|nr:universal stress protein [Desulfobulbaceae bacterium]